MLARNSIVRKLAAAFFAILFIASAVAMLFLYNFEQQFLNPDAYQHALIDGQFYQSLPGLVASQIAHRITTNPCLKDPAKCSGQPEETPPQYLKNLTPEDWEIILADLITPDWVKAQTGSLIEQALAGLNTAQSPKPVTISLVEIKTRLRGEPGSRAFIQLVNAQPDCTPEDALKWANFALASLAANRIEIDAMPLCRPPGELLNSLTPLIQVLLSGISATIPDQAALSQVLTGQIEAGRAPATSPSESALRAELHALITWIHWATSLGPLVLAILLGLVTLFGVRSLKGWLRWWGLPSVLVGLAGCGIALVLLVGLDVPILQHALGVYITKIIPLELTPDLIQVVVEVGDTLFRNLFLWLVVEAGAVGATGLVMLGISLFLHEN